MSPTGDLHLEEYADGVMANHRVVSMIEGLQVRRHCILVVIPSFMDFAGIHCIGRFLISDDGDGFKCLEFCEHDFGQ